MGSKHGYNFFFSNCLEKISIFIPTIYVSSYKFVKNIYGGGGQHRRGGGERERERLGGAGQMTPQREQDIHHYFAILQIYSGHFVSKHIQKKN